MDLRIENLSATIDGAAVEVVAPPPSARIPMIRLPRDYVSPITQSPLMGAVQDLAFTADQRRHVVYLVYDERHVLERDRRDLAEATCAIGLVLTLAPEARRSGLSLEVDGKAVAVDEAGQARFTVQRAIRRVQRVSAGRTPAGGVVRVRPAALFGDSPERAGVVPIRVRVLPGPRELEIRWIPHIDQVNDDTVPVSP